MTRIPYTSRLQFDLSGGWKRRGESLPLDSRSLLRVKAKQMVVARNLREHESSIKDFIHDVTKGLLIVELGSAKREFERTRTESAVKILSGIVSLTTRLFGEDVKVYESFDPEYPEDTYTVFSVQSEQPVEELCQAEQEWVRSLATIAPACDSIRLELCPR